MGGADLHTLSPDELVGRLVDAGEEPDAALRGRIREVGEPCVAALVRVMADENLNMEDAPDGGWAPTSAARLLGEMRSVGAIGPMLEVLRGCDTMEVLFSAIMLALPKMGEAVVEPALRAYAGTEDPDYRNWMCAVLAESKVRDERIWNLLLEELATDADAGAMNLAEYGDATALPMLGERLEGLLADADGLMDDMAIIELCAAIEVLGGTLTADQRAKRETAANQRHTRFAAMRAQTMLDGDDGGDDGEFGDAYDDDDSPAASEPYVRETPKVGRNEPCPCGSGKKYKKCHGMIT